MAVLDETNRWRTWAHAMRDALIGGIPNCTKADWRAAIDATDDWIEANAASYNSALPQPFRSNATLIQKTAVFCLVAMRRANRLPTRED